MSPVLPILCPSCSTRPADMDGLFCAPRSATKPATAGWMCQECGATAVVTIGDDTFRQWERAVEEEDAVASLLAVLADPEETARVFGL